MKIIKFAIILLSACIAFSSCQKQLDFEGGISIGTLKSAVGGNCSPVIINGIFKVDSVLNNDNYVDVQVNVTMAGTFDVKSDTVNGYSFHKAGTISTGLGIIRLYASGKPIATGVNTFTISYGATTCSFNITVFDNGTGGTAQYTLGGSPGNCSVSSLNGSYVLGQAMTPANTVEMTVNVTTIGTYNIIGTVINGVSFNASGAFTNPGVQNIFLSATGTPLAPGTFNYPVTNAVTTCNFSVTYTNTTTPAVYTLGGSPGNCTGVALTGTYMATVSTSAANTAKVDVNVTSTGSYSLATPTVNGVKFSASGNFTVMGPQAVTLTANTAIPPAQGPFTYNITGAGTNCSFTVTYLPAPPPASFTLSGDPGNCTPATVNGTYTVGTALTASNNIVVEVNVTVAGAYTITTNTVNGMQFAKSGVFSATGLQNVTLSAVAGSNPTTPGVNTLTPLAGSSSCTIDITVTAPSDRVYSFKIGATTYSGPCSAILIGGGSETMTISDPNPSRLDLELVNPTGAITTGFYSGTSTAGKYAQLAYGLQFLSAPGSGLTNLSANITSLNTVTRVVEGTFSGTVVDISLNTLTITNGTFKADY